VDSNGADRAAELNRTKWPFSVGPGGRIRRNTHKDIASKNWELFKGLLSFGPGKKEQQLRWIDQLNDIRKIVMHSSKNVPVTLGQLAQLEETEEWLDAKLELEKE